MHNFTAIKDIVVILLVSIPIIFLFKKIHIPSIVGFLIAGMIIGPYGFKLISGLEQIEAMAEVGVILLLFTIGLEVSLSKLMKIKKLLFLTGGLQVLLTIIISALIFLLFNLEFNKAVFIGLLISLSSTAIVLNLLSEKNELEAPHGRISLSILIFQDLAVVPMFLLLPILGSEEASSFSEIILQLLFAFGMVAVIIVLAKFLMPKILFQLAKLRVREVFTIGVLLLLLGTAYLTYSFGLSFALGAFIAGLILSESEFSHQVVADILPLKDAFNSIFFVSVGLLLNFTFVLKYPLLLIAVIIGIILLKSSIIILIVKLSRYPLRVAVLSGFALAQIGEFSFILSQAGLSFNLIEPDFYNAFLASSIFTMLLTPFLFKLTPVFADKFGWLDTIIDNKKIETKKSLENHVVIVGFGLNGKNLAKVLKEAGINYIVVELNPETVKQEKQKGENIIYGDITKKEILFHTNIENAGVIVFVISDPRSLIRGLQSAKEINPNIYAIVRTRFISETDDLIKLGADEVIPEEFETSLQIFSKVLRRYHVPLNVIMKQIQILRNESYGFMRKEPGAVHPLSNINEILAAGLTETYFINDDNIHVGKTLSEINLRAKTDASIIAIVRDGKTISTPSGKEIINKNDTLVITGTHAAVDKAFELLDEKI